MNPKPLPHLRRALYDLPGYRPTEGVHEVPPPRLLSANESPEAPPRPAVDAAARAAAAVHRYPDPGCTELVAELARTHRIGPERFVAGAGSVALLQLLFQAVAEPGAEAVLARPSFELYRPLAELAGVRPVQVPLTGHVHDLPAMAERVTARTGLVVVCDPNNPTGTAVPAAELAAFLDRVPPTCLVAIDQAYAEYVRDLAAFPRLASDRPNVVVLRTFSKAYGLAGLRVGYLVADARVAEQLRKGVPAYSVGSVAQAAAVAALREPARMRAVTDATVAERARVRAVLLRAGWDVPPSEANFLWLRLGEAAERFAGWCAGRRVAVRCFAGQGVRVTVGTSEDNDDFLAAAAAWRGAARSREGVPA
ncbi:histidinol-phosphate transaminase [Amycolatopsis sp. CA-126428]|uniref:histidinol-phosphate transaminase n=1 Tax=Amycolatopsis sp. CA-126428 TaxID=2073158 RepID=UPI000CD27327|nr:histidinol-phosphate transaminase [Amycolatopsis sp. CA-126428]